MITERMGQLVMGGFYSFCVGIDTWQCWENFCGKERMIWQQKALDAIRLLASSTWTILWAESSSFCSLGARVSSIQLISAGAFGVIYGASIFEKGARDWLHIAGYVALTFWSVLIGLEVFIPSNLLLTSLQMGVFVVGVGLVSLSLFGKFKEHERKIIKA